MGSIRQIACRPGRRSCRLSESDSVESGLENLGWRSELPSLWSKRVIGEVQRSRGNRLRQAILPPNFQNVIVALITISGYHEWQDTARPSWYFMLGDGSRDRHYSDLTQLAVVVRQGVNRATISPEVQCNGRFLALISLAGGQSIHGY